LPQALNRALRESLAHLPQLGEPRKVG
jgi:hypothetical protein